MGVPVSDIKLKPSNAGYWESAQPVLKDISDVHATEKTVIHRDLCYKGIFDCVANYRYGKLLYAVVIISPNEVFGDIMVLASPPHPPVDPDDVNTLTRQIYFDIF